MPGSDLDIPQIHARIKHGRNESMAEHVRVRPGDLYTRSVGQAPQAAGRGVAVHPGAVAVQQDRPTVPGAGRPVDRPAHGGWQRDQDDLGAFAAHPQHAVAVFLAQVGDVGTDGFEDPQAEQPEHGDQREVAGGAVTGGRR